MNLTVKYKNGFVRKVKFLVDTGAEISLIRPDMVPPGLTETPSAPVRLMAVNNNVLGGGDKSCVAEITLFGEEIRREFPMFREKKFSAELYTADIKVEGILSYDWLATNKMGVMLHRECLLLDVQNPEWLTAENPQIEENEEEQSICTTRMGESQMTKTLQGTHVNKISMGTLEEILSKKRWDPPKLKMEFPFTKMFPDKERMQRKTNYIREVSKYIHKENSDSPYEFGEEEWEEIAEHLVRVDEEEQAINFLCQSHIANSGTPEKANVDTVIEGKEMENEFLEELRKKFREKYRETVFRDKVWADPPIRGPYGEAKLEMKPGIVPHIQRPFAITGERRQAMIDIISEFEDWGLLEQGISPWLIPAFPVKKKEAGKWRLVVH